jgi:uncharacterized membrane protein
MAQTSDTSSRTGQQSRSTSRTSVASKPNAVKPWLARLGTSNWLWCVLVAAVALGFDLYRLGNPSIWFDEAFSVELARQPLPVIWHVIWGPEPNMELYYLFLHFWLGFTGLFGLLPTEFVVRLPSAIFAVLSSVMVFLLGRRYLGLAGGILASGLYTLNFLQLTYAQQTRAYSMQLLFICIAWYALFAILSRETHTRRWWACFILVSTLAVYDHLFSALILASQVIAFACLYFLPNAWQAAARRTWRAFLVSLVIIGVLIIPMLLVSLHGPKTGWLPIPHLSDIYHLFLTITTDSKIYLLLLFLCCAFAIGVALLPRLPGSTQLLLRITFYQASDETSSSRSNQYLPIACALLCWLLVPILLSFVISQGSIRLFSSRYLVTILPALFLLVGMAVAALRWRVVQAALIVGLLLIALRYVPIYYQSAQVEDWNTAVPWLEQRYQPGDGLVCYIAMECQLSTEYYLDAYPSGAHFTPDTPGLFSWERFGMANPNDGPDAAIDPQKLAAFAAHHPRIFFIAGRIPDPATAAKVKAAQQWLDSHYHLIARIHTPTVTISLYATS